MCRSDDGDGPEFMDVRNPRARKPHVCDECARTIQPGEQYQVVAGLWDGDLRRFKTCAHCVMASGWLEEQCDGYGFGRLREEIEEHWHEGYKSAWMGRAIVGMRRGWKRHDGALLAVPSEPPPTSYLTTWDREIRS